MAPTVVTVMMGDEGLAPRLKSISLTMVGVLVWKNVRIR